MRRLRRNLRIILDLAINDELNRLSQLNDLYSRKRINNGLTPSQWKRSSMISQQENDLMYGQSHSILNCSRAFSAHTQKDIERHSVNNKYNLDMVWNPVSKGWLCIHCFEALYGNEKDRMKFEVRMKRVDRIHERLFRRNHDNFYSYTYNKDYAKYMEKEIFCLVGTFSKFSQKQAEDLIDAAGGAIQPQIDRNLDYLILAKTESLPYYRNFLKNRKTKIIPESQFLEFMREVYVVWLDC